MKPAMDLPHEKNFHMMDLPNEKDIPTMSSDAKSMPHNQIVHDVGPSSGPSSPPSVRLDEDRKTIDTDFKTKGSMNIMMTFHDDPDDQKDGAVIRMEKSDMSLHCSVPHKSGSRCFISFEGNSTFMKQRGFAMTTLSFGYRVFNGLSLLTDFNTADGLFKSSYGTSYETKGSSTKTMIHYPSQVRSTMEPTIVSFSNSTSLNEMVSSEVNIGLSSANKTKPLISSFRIGLTAIHKSSLPAIKLYLDFFQRIPLKLSFQYSLDDCHKHLSNSSTELAIGLGRDTYEMNAFICRAVEKFSKFSMGIGHSTWHGLSWIFRYEKGDLCLNVPIQVAKCTKLGLNTDTLMYSISTAYLSFLSATIHAIIGELTQTDRVAPLSSDLEKERAMLSVTKARDHAQSQIMLMTRKADINRRAEESKSGLVILKAIYSVTDGESLDVTVPLQFWVLESKLALAASSFSSMLGFYDIGMTQLSNATGDKRGHGLLEAWKSLFDTSSKEITMPTLHVRYKFNGKTHEICVQDDEALVLPTPRALEI